ncbi:MAG TPA: disulfide oxidoreductase [Herpetosiphonaceae bacterium]|nr:disulfide oxidoreductase [Herpetosiphonaceae bacterium]
MDEEHVQIEDAAEGDVGRMGAVDRFFLSLAPFSRYIALLAAWTALCGSLFFSQVIGWIPCTLCWYQRILMYPLAVIIAVGILRRDRALHLYVLPLSILGATVSLYHYLLIKTHLFPSPPCMVGVPCTVDYLNLLGFINIPLLALTAFLIIASMMALSLAAPTPVEEEMHDEAEVEDALAEAGERLGLGDFAVFAIIAIAVIAYVTGAHVVRA